MSMGVVVFSKVGHADSVYVYDTLKVKAILDNWGVEA